MVIVHELAVDVACEVKDGDYDDLSEFHGEEML